MNCEYVRDYYQVPAVIGRIISHRGRSGIIAEDRGHYIGVNFDDDKPGHIYNVHPTDKVEYKSIGKVRKMTRSQQRYQDYLRADFGCSFAEYLGIKP
ncbi:MAG: hypothetical protein OEY11_15120 [Gammaproteobacteria bacterium]|nr:hypothetical protein [Gammaproteobacteria bacterium]